MKFWIVLIAISLLVAPKALADDSPQPDAADGEPEAAHSSADHDGDNSRADIEALLSHYHELPDRETLEESDDDARSIVFEIARDDEAFLMHRQRAMSALAHWPDDEVYEFLVEQLDDDQTEDGLRHHLLPVVANGFGEDALEDIEPYLLEDSDPQIRISAAGAIAHNIEGERGIEMLEEALEQEDNPIVERRLEDYLDDLR